MKTEVPTKIPVLLDRLIGLAAVHGAKGPRTDHAAQELFDALKIDLAATEGRLTLEAAWNQLTFQGQPLPLRGRGSQRLRALHRRLRRMDIGILYFQKNVLADELARFAHFLAAARTGEGGDRFRGIVTQMAEGGIFGISIERKAEEPDIPKRQLKSMDKAECAALYMDVLYRLAEILDEMKEGRSPQVVKLRRLTQQVVEQAYLGNETFLAMTAVKRHESFLHAHAVNTAIFAAWLAIALGLRREKVLTIVQAAILADVGLFFNAKFILDKIETTGEFNPLEWSIVRRHPLEGAKLLLKGEGLSDFTIRALLVAFQHHYHEQLPLLTALEATDLYSRIIAICDCFDALVTTRDKKAALSPPLAHGVLFRDSGKFFDAPLVKLFTQTIGLYPTGTLCRLSDGRIGIVRRQNSEPDYFDRPIIRVFGADEVPMEDVVDLAASPDLEVERTYTLGDLGLNVPTYVGLL